MYQSHLNYTGPGQEAFEELMINFSKEMKITLDSFSSEEWDLSKTYFPNHACLWNDYQKIGRRCVILQKNDKMALVAFSEKSPKPMNLLHCLYRLEDLSEVK